MIRFFFTRYNDDDDDDDDETRRRKQEEEETRTVKELTVLIETSIKMEPWNFYQNGNLLFSISLLSEWAPISIRIEKLLSGTDRNRS